MNRVWRKVAASLGIFALVFAQLAVSAYACPGSPSGMAEPVVWQASSACDEMDRAAANLCDKYCHDAEQSQAAYPGVHAAFVPGFTVIVQLPTLVTRAPAGANPALRHATFPSVTIRNCCFRI